MYLQTTFGFVFNSQPRRASAELDLPEFEPILLSTIASQQHSMATSSLLHINGRPLFVESTGSDTLPLLVALHGLGGSTNLFPIASWLADKFTVVRFDFEGAGKSPYGEGAKWEISDLVEDVKAVVEALGRGGEAIHLFGHSLGSAVSILVL